jgi:zinc/manganese transport system substrate-binding protein
MKSHIVWVVILALAACSGAPSAASHPSSGSPVSSTPAPSPLAIVAGENFYGDLATQLGGSHVRVTSILSDPSVDPHLYESNVDNAKAVGAASLVIKNGMGYDAFMDKLLAASPRPARIVIDVGQAMGAQDGANPHLWYKPDTMPRLAQVLTDRLSQLDPANSADFNAGLQRFNTSLKPLQDRIATMKAKDAGLKVLPTEPVFDYTADALGLEVVDKEGAFQRAVEEGNDPPADAVGKFRQQLASHAIKALIYNSQAVTPITSQMQNTAKQNNVPVVGVTETEPPGKNYQQWMLDQLDQLQRALSVS